ncbi:hypothetical protein [Enterococcus faecium]|uniref:hypothetical protein n=1 Tax=Enterococcus faecium TaxID=1352 RepID=UPI00223BC358|nr:hypothetical protein [Enterococcus faecium]MCS8593051.1 hypothetical protein [Enterococcus faecium]
MKTLNRFDRMLISFLEDDLDFLFYLLAVLIITPIPLICILYKKMLFFGLSFLFIIFLLFLINFMRVSEVRNNLKKIIEKELIRSHYWYPQNFKSNMDIKIKIEKIYKNGKVDFTVFVTHYNYLFENYLIGSYDKEQLTNIQIVSIECLKLPKIFSVLEEDSISFYKLHSKFSKTIFYAEGITTNNQKVEITASNEEIKIKIDDKTKTTKKLLEITNSYVDMENQGLIAATTRNSKLSKEKD